MVSTIYYRGGMVDKDHQYRFIYAALYEYWEKKRDNSQSSFSFFRNSIEETEDERESVCNDADDDDDDDDDRNYPSTYKCKSFSFDD